MDFLPVLKSHCLGQNEAEGSPTHMGLSGASGACYLSRAREMCKRKKQALDKKVLRLEEESVNPFCGI